MKHKKEKAIRAKKRYEDKQIKLLFAYAERFDRKLFNQINNILKSVKNEK